MAKISARAMSRMRYRDLPLSVRLEMREMSRAAFVSRIMKKAMSKPKVHVTFCEQYFRCLQLLEMGGDNHGMRKGDRCTVAWFERRHPRLATAIESRCSRLVEENKCSNADGPRHLTFDEIVGDREYIPSVHRISFSRDWYLYSGDGNDDAVKVIEDN